MSGPFDQLETVLEQIITRWGIPGLAIGMVEGEAILYTRCFGVQNLNTGTRVTEDSIFCVASISKPFVASAIMRLVEQGVLNLDSPLVEYVPYFRLADEPYKQITLRQMLSHTSGMPDMDESAYDDLVYHPESDTGAAERYVRSLANKKMIASPGERFYYSNIAYNVLGYLISVVSGQTFESYLKDHILLPSGMPNSTFLLEEIDPSRLVLPHLRIPEMVVNPKYPYHRADAPASFLHSTVMDMCHWCSTCLNRGRYNGNAILLPKTLDLMWSPVASRGNFSPFYEEIGLGWTLGHYNGLKAVSHGGMGFGWGTFLVYFPEANRGAVILINDESSARDYITLAVVDALFDRPPHPGPVSFAIPVAQALQHGGVEAAYACYKELKRQNSSEYFFDQFELVNLVYPLVTVEKYDLAINVLNLNLHIYPESVGTRIFLAKLLLQRGATSEAKRILLQALELSPDQAEVVELLNQISSIQ